MKPWQWTLGSIIIGVKVVAYIGTVGFAIAAVALGIRLAFGSVELETAVGVGLAAVVLLLLDIRTKLYGDD